jgi:hypothetical protein
LEQSKCIENSKKCSMKEKMKKRILALVAVLALVGALVPATVFAANTGTVSCTVTAVLVSVTVTPGSVAYGTLALGATKNTAQYNAANNTYGMVTPQTQYIENTGTVNENFKIKTSNAAGATNWTLGSTAGSDTFTHAYNMQGTAPYNGSGAITFTKWAAADIYVAAGTTTAPTGHNYLELEIGMPDPVTDYGSHTITVTVLAEAA